MIKYSLVIATLGRKEELREMLFSVVKQNCNLEYLEIIIVDQNNKDFLTDILNEFNFLNLVYIHSDIKGLSLNRNIGLKYCTGSVVCFPDDDCMFYNNTFDEVEKELDKYDFCIGRIFDREKNKNILKNWPQKRFKINRFNSYFISSSITLFVRKKALLKFDENMGVGAPYGAGEDSDFIYRLIKNKFNGLYSPKIELWHPEASYEEISLKKVQDYAAGFGYLVRKDIDYIKVILLLLLLLKKSFQFVFNIFNKKFQKKYFYCYFNGVIKGLLKSNQILKENNVQK